MKQNILYIAIIIILSFVLFVLFLNLKPRTTDIEQRTYTIGTTQQLYKPGKDSVTISTKSFHSAIILKPSAVDSTFNLTSGDSTYKLSLNIRNSAGSSLSLEYFLNINSKDLVRIDTIFQTRIDTLKIKEVIIEKQDPPFYNTFLFGALTTALVIIFLIQLIP